MHESLIFIILGLLAGTAAGLLGIGGGIILIPALLYIFSLIQIDPAIRMQMAIGTSLASMVLSTLSSSFAHYRRSSILFPIVFSVGIGSIFGSICGAYLVSNLPEQFLRYFFGLFECFLGARFLLVKSHQHDERTLPKKPLLTLIGFCISSISTLLGISGALLNVPILHYFSVPIRKAIGTSSALAFIVSLIGTLSFLVIDIHTSETSTLIYLPAFLWISIATLFAAPLGVRLAHFFQPEYLKKILGSLLVVTGLILILT